VASILSHPAVALGLKPWFQRTPLPPRIWLLGAVCTILPDADVITFRFGIPYGAMFGHRGFTHSLVFAALLSALLAGFSALFGVRRSSRLALFVYLFLCTASHGVFDAMTNGGLGVAFFAPFSPERYFFPWRPIRVSLIVVRNFFSARGLAILQSELLWVWLPVLAVGLVGSRLLARRTKRW
jgi:inner membrane protein